MKISALYFAFAAFLAASHARALTLHVDANALPNGDGSSWAHAFTSIQDAIDTPGVTRIIVTNGVYAPIITTNAVLTIQSVNGAAHTFIDGGGVKRCATLGVIKKLNQRNTVLIGFTLRNGKKQYRDGQLESADGGGVIFGTLINCVICDSVADYGGGVRDANLIQCVLKNNNRGTPF